MTATELNSIPKEAYEKFNNLGFDVLTLDIGIYVTSPTKLISPCIKSLKYTTVDYDANPGLYGVHIQRYNKADYRTVKSIYPVESFGTKAECYYIFYIGNDWLYSYRDGSLVKLKKTADELLGSINSNWLEFKQYAMSARELKAVPESVINNLFVNEDYSNTEFGVIYVTKTKEVSSEQFTVDFKLLAEGKYVNPGNVTLEIATTGNNIIEISSKDFSEAAVNDFLSWLEAKQKGVGNDFFVIKGNDKQYFINYYMISSINVQTDDAR